jgi:glycosyltransferase involved in cell wall biosynthesis
MPRIIISTSNDISTDNRVHKVAMVLLNVGFDVLWAGRQLPDSLPLDKPYATKRFKLWFNRGALFYANLNMRLFVYLLFKKTDVYLSNDLDTLWANRWASRLRGKKLVYDTHEYFLGVPEIQHRPLVKWFWGRIEKSIFPKLPYIFTVNESIATLYEKDYNRRPIVFRNISMPPEIRHWKSREELDLPIDKFIFINQGSGINVDRGMEEVLEAMAQIDRALLLIVGTGDAIPALKKRAEKPDLTGKVRFIDRMPYEALLHYTHAADVGITLDKDTNINYKYSLPNKVFDYIYCEIPILSSRVVEVASLVKRYNIGVVAKDHATQTLVACMRQLMEQPKDLFVPGLEKAGKDLNWEKEKRVIVDFYTQLKKEM